MKILVINPVGHSTWDEPDKALYRRYLPPDVEVDVRSLPRGPLTVETVEAYREVVPLVVETGKDLIGGYSGLVVNCFLDPGVEELRRETGGIVLGAGEASLTLAKLYGHPVYVLTVGAEKETIELMWERVKKLGFEKIVPSIVGIPIGVVDIDKDRVKALGLILEVAKSITVKESNLVTIVLGCTGFGGLGEELQRLVKVPVVDPVKASALLIASLVKLIKLYS